MNIPRLPGLIRLALLHGLMRLAAFVLRRALAPAMRPAAVRTPCAGRNAAPGPRIIDGEFYRIHRSDPRHNNSW